MNNFKVFRSSAGSGKTFTLTKEYLKLALATPYLKGEFDPSYYKNILAVTFTNDAANEMRERIVGQLSAFADLKKGEKDEMLSMICEEIKTEFPTFNISEETLIRRAKETKEVLLHNYSDFSVSTIDSFNNQIVQAFKKDLNLPYNYELELDTSEILEKATYELLQKIGTAQHKTLSRFLVSFAVQKANENNSWYIERELSDFGKNIFNETRHQIIQEIKEITPQEFQEIKNDLYGFTDEINAEVKKIACSVFKKITENHLPVTAFYRGKTGIHNFFRKTATENVPLQEIKTDSSFVLKSINEDKWHGAKATAAEKMAIDSISEEMKRAFHKIKEIKETQSADYIVAQELQKKIFLLSTINEFDSEVQLIKEEKNLVHISDFNKKINQIVENEPVPYIYERIGEKFRHILIDEFQDTSKMQWHNLIPLVTNALATGMPNMIVGDAKQAIYSWRGGKSEMLVNLPEVPTAAPDSLIAENGFIFREQYHPQELQTNYRSCENVIKFNNHFFSTSADFLSEQFPSVKEFYKEVQQKNTKKSGGHISFSFFNYDIKSGGAKSLPRFNAERTLEIIHQLKSQNYKYQDIAILTRANKEGAFIAQQLLVNNIPVISSESLLLTTSWAVRFIVDFIQLINNSSQPILKVELLHFISKELPERNGQLQGNNNEEMNFSKAISVKSYSEFQAIAQTDSLADFLEFISENFDYHLDTKDLQLFTLYELAEEFIRIFGLGKHKEQQIYLQKLLDELLNYSTKNGSNLDDFLDFWERKKGNLSINTPKGSDAVKVISVHKSKGLQFPVVILPFCHYKTTPSPKSEMWLKWKNHELAQRLPAIILPIAKKLEESEFANQYKAITEAMFLESFNILYVAFTRSEEKLFILSKEKPKKPTEEVKNVQTVFHSYLDLLSNTSELNSIEKTLSLSKNAAKDAESLNYREVVLHKDQKPKVQKKAIQSQKNEMIEEFIHAQASVKRHVRGEDSISLQQLSENNDVLSAREKGVLVHYAFEKMKYQDDISSAVEKLVNEGLLTKEEAAAQIQKMKTITSLENIKRYYQKGIGLKIRNERELLLKTPEGTKSLRPDRLVFDKQTAIIIDYKTGVENTEKYKYQLSGYALALKKMGYSDIKSFIVYTELVKAVEV